MIQLLLIYWIATTIGGAIYLAKTRFNHWETEEPDEHYTLLDIVGNIFPALIFGWLMFPAYLMTCIKFKK